MSAPQRTRARRPNRIEKALMRWLMRPATIVSVEPLSPRFRLIDLEGEALKGVAWTPGDKIQVMLGGLLVARTYTPVLWDADRGRTRILAWSHGSAPGSDWATGLAEGDTCQFFGPRRSLDVRKEAPIALFGDETSFGLALARAQVRQGEAASHLLLEVDSAEECAAVLERVDLPAATLVERVPDDGHLGEIERRLEELAAGASDFVLTGRAPAIQRLSRALKNAGVTPSRLRAKAYWAPGKTGLD